MVRDRAPTACAGPCPELPDELFVTGAIAASVRYRRRQRGLTQSELADQLGISTALLEDYESGRADISAARLWRLAQALEMTVGQLFWHSRSRPEGDLPATDNPACPPPGLNRVETTRDLPD